MKAGLKRIEATLHDLGTRPAETSSSREPSFSFRISVGTAESTTSDSTPSQAKQETLEESVDSHTQTAENLFRQHDSVQTFPAQENGCSSPTLPKLKTQGLSSHRHGANPALAINLLAEIQQNVTVWQKELQKILQQIQDVYLEGPIVNGWLESQPRSTQPGGTATLRHAEVDKLMDYVEEICAAQGQEVSYQAESSVGGFSPLRKLSQTSAGTGYRLCGMDTSGKVWSRPCPPDQLPSVSMAIARYQKLRQLLGRKQHLETRLSQLAETLVVLHSHIQTQ